LLAGCGTFHEDEAVPLSAVPSVVQSTIQAHANGGMVGKVEKETEKGRVVYEAKVKGKDGKCTEVAVAEDGTLVKAEADDAEGEHHCGKGGHDKNEGCKN
jgi:hypothetical protein